MKTLLMTTTAIALLACGPVLAQAQQDGVVPEGTETPEIQQSMDGAQDATAPVVGVLFLPSGAMDHLYASDLIGMNVHSSQADYGTYGDQPVASADLSGWDAIGEISDIVITAGGETQGILVDVGGFLGMGGRTVALDMGEVHFLTDENGERFVAVNSTREELENAPEYVRQEDMAGMGTVPVGQDPMTADTTTAPDAVPPTTEGEMAQTDPAVTTPRAEMGDPAAPMGMTRPAFTREGYQDVEYTALTAAELEGATVYDRNDENIGDISDLVLSADGAIDQAVVDVGGFLGIGAHSVALSFDELQILRAGDGSDIRVYIDQTRENLEARPAYEG